MQVSTSKQRPLVGVANRTPSVATTGTRNAAARHDQRVVVVLLVALQVPLQLDVHVGAAEHADEPIEQPAHAVALGRAAAARPTSATRPAVLPVEIVERQRALALGRAQLHARDQAAEVAPAFLRGDKHRQDEVRSER